MSDAARDIDNLLKCFHDERSVLKQQVRCNEILENCAHLSLKVPDRVDKDFSNKSASSGATLTKTFSYLAKRNLGQLRGTDLLLVYNLVNI